MFDYKVSAFQSICMPRTSAVQTTNFTSYSVGRKKMKSEILQSVSVLITAEHFTLCTCTVFVSIGWDHVPCHEEVWESGGKSPCILHFITKWQLVVRYTNISENMSVLDWGERSASRSETFVPRKQHPVNHLVGDKNLFSQPGIKPRFLFVQSVAKSLYWLRFSRNRSYREVHIHFKPNSSVLSPQVLEFWSQERKFIFTLSSNILRNVRLFSTKVYVLGPCANLSNDINSGVMEEMLCSY
jgi:hypothetical protein